MFITKEIQRSEKLSNAEVERLDKMIDEIERSSSSMVPEIWKPDATVIVDSNYGGQHLDGSLFTKQQIAELKRLAKTFTGSKSQGRTAQKIYDIVKNYLEGSRIEGLEVVEGGWMAHLTMPGYMDQTDPTRYDTLKEAIEGLHEEFADTDLEEEGDIYGE
jgi:hypothetical protein